jgi:hypothetical protein
MMVQEVEGKGLEQWKQHEEQHCSRRMEAE